MRFRFLALVLLAGCGSTSPRDPGVASVHGTVLDDSRLPVANTPVRVACPGIDAANIQTDASGRFFVSLQLPGNLMTGQGTTVECEFSAPQRPGGAATKRSSVVFWMHPQPTPPAEVTIP